MSFSNEASKPIEVRQEAEDSLHSNSVFRRNTQASHQPGKRSSPLSARERARGTQLQYLADRSLGVDGRIRR